MSSTTLTPTRSETPTVDRGGGRGLIWAVAALTVVVLGLGAWLISDLTAQDELAVPADVQTLIDDWWQSLERGDGSVVSLYTSNGYHLYGDQMFTGDDIASHLQQGDDHKWTTDPVLIVDENGRYVVAAGISNQLFNRWYTSAVTFEIVTTNDGLRFAHTAWSKIS